MVKSQFIYIICGEKQRKKEGVNMLFLSSIILIGTGFAFMAVGLWIHPNVIDTIINGSFGFSLVGVLFLIMGIACATKATRDYLIERSLKKKGKDYFGYISHISPIFRPRGSKKRLIGYHIDVFVHRDDTKTTDKQYIFVKVPLEINKGYVLVRNYKNTYRFLENVDKNNVPKMAITQIEKEIDTK